MLFHLIQTTALWGTGTIIISILHVREWRPREVMVTQCALGHGARGRQTGDPQPPAWEPCFSLPWECAFSTFLDETHKHHQRQKNKGSRKEEFKNRKPETRWEETKLKIYNNQASLVAQWLRVRLPMQGTRVRALAWEDPTCRGATRPVSHNYWACASGSCAPQQERPRQWEARAPRWRVAPTCHN